MEQYTFFPPSDFVTILVLDRSGEARCLKRSVLMETLANDLPIGTVCFGCRILTVELDPITSYPILQLQDGRVIKAKV